VKWEENWGKRVGSSDPAMDCLTDAYLHKQLVWCNGRQQELF